MIREFTVYAVPGLALVIAILAFRRAYLDRRDFRRGVGALEIEVAETRTLLQRRAQLARELAHEVKHPLGAIACAANTLEHLGSHSRNDGGELPLRAMREHAEHALRLVSDFLELTRSDGFEPELWPENVALRDSVESVIRLLSAQAKVRGVQLRMVTTEPVLAAYVDRRHFVQMLFNIIHNAIKFSPDCGEVRVIMTSDFPRPCTKVIVQDNGCGIPPHVLGAIEGDLPLHMSAQRESDPRSGLGIGLMLSRRLALRNGGALQLESSIGVGTRVTLSLPQAHVADSTKQVPKGSLAGRRVLLVEPQGEHGHRLVGLLQSCGATVEHIAEATEAMRTLAAAAADIVLVDEDLYTAEFEGQVRAAASTKGGVVLLESLSAGSVRPAVQDGEASAKGKDADCELLEVLVDIARPRIEH